MNGLVSIWQLHSPEIMVTHTTQDLWGGTPLQPVLQAATTVRIKDNSQPV